MKLGLLGFGEVGYTFARGLRDLGQLIEIYAFDQNQASDWQGELIKRRSEETGVTLVNNIEGLAQSADLILSIVPASVSIKVTWEVSSILPEKPFCDLSSAAPNVKREASEIMTGEQGIYLDGAILGSMATYGFKVPIYLSGPNANHVSDDLRKIGFNVKPVGPEAGTASAVKMLRSSFTKGIEALILETFYAATLFKAEDTVLETLSDTFDQEKFSETVKRYITSSAIHAGRRVNEINSVADFLKEVGIEPYMAQASRQRLAWMAGMGLRDKFQGIAPEDFREVFKAISRV